MSNQASNISSVDLAIVPGTVYIQDCVWNQLSKLYTLDLATGKATFIGEIINRSLWYYLCWFSTLWHRSSTSSIKCSLLLTSHHWKMRKMYPLNNSGRATHSGTILRHLRCIVERFTPDYWADTERCYALLRKKKLSTPLDRLIVIPGAVKLATNSSRCWVYQH